MKRLWLFLGLALFALSTEAETECDQLHRMGVDLLPNTIFNVTYGGPLSGCFAAFLPNGEHLYRFGVFRNGLLAVSLPVVEAGGDMVQSKGLKIHAVSFKDLDGDGQRDVTVIGQRLAAKGKLIFAQVFYGCTEEFIYDDQSNDKVDAYLVNRPVINLAEIKGFIAKHKLGHVCGKGRRTN